MSPQVPAAPARAWAVVVAVIAASAAAGFLLHRMGRQRQTLYPLPQGSVATDAGHEAPGQPLAVPANTRAIPEDIPKIVLRGVDGRSHALADYRGKLLVVNFWATWCDPCRREIPLLKSLRSEYAKDGVEIVGIAVDSSADVARYAREHAMTYPVLLGERGGLEAASAFGMDVVLPFSVFADRAGHIVALKVGELRPEEAHTILAGLQELDAGHLTVKAAQAQIAASLAALNARRAAGAGASEN